MTTTPATPTGNNKPCPGCVGRGTGTLCCVCGGIIPAHLLRTPWESSSEWRWDCFGCLAGTAHVHHDSRTAHVDDPAGDNW